MRNGERRLALGGPRVELPSEMGVRDFDGLRADAFDDEWRVCVQYLCRLVELPAGVRFDPARRWGGVMAFPADEGGPFVGTVEGCYGHTLHLSTGYESSGFRQAFGGGRFLAHLLLYGDEWADAEGARDVRCAKWRNLAPTRRRRVVFDW